MNGKLKGFSLSLIFAILLSTSVSFAAPSNWAQSEVTEAIQNDLVTDRVQSNYQDNITREEFAELIVKLYSEISGQEAPKVSTSPFTDTNNPSVLSANKLNIINGIGNNLFAPNDRITREQIATMFYRMVNTIDSSKIQGTYTLEFSDKANVSTWARESVAYMNTKGIIKGTGNNEFGPKGSATREQAILLVLRTFKGFDDLELGETLVHFIDVGQGAAVLIQSDNSNMIIDAGDNAYGDRVVAYLKENGVNRLDYVIGTHPHADHIGGLDDVINSFDVGKVLMPNVSHTSKTFEDVLLAVQNNGLKLTKPNVGDTYNLGDSTYTIMAPNSASYSNLNDYSITVKLSHGDNSFLFTGDIESTSESEMVSNNSSLPLDVDVLQVPHHGSNSSSTSSFLSAASPEYAVIQVGEDNNYGHPSQDIVSRLSSIGASIFRTDIHGNIVFTSNQTSLSVNSSPWTPSTPPLEETPSEPEYGKVDINSASVEELQEIIHIGPVYAERIVALRPFSSVRELTRVSGIGDSRVQDIIDQGIAYVK